MLEKRYGYTLTIGNVGALTKQGGVQRLWWVWSGWRLEWFT
jgi:hypothetical protein